MNEKQQKYFWYALVLAALLVNETMVQWALAIFVGKLGFVDGFKDAFKYFSVSGYLFFTAFRLIPYLVLASVVKSSLKKRSRTVSSIAWGGLAGIVFALVMGAWYAQHAYYTDVHVSSTTAIAFIFIPLYAIVPGMIGALLGWVFCVLKARYVKLE